jgi:hypothetical protein
MPEKLNKDIELTIRFRLINKGDDKPLDGNRFKVRLYDKDVFNDEYLGESLIRDGRVFFMISKRDFRAPLNLDVNPDFYFVVYQDDKQIFKSKVMENVDLANMEEFVMKEGEVIDLGTFLIAIGD